MEDNLIFKFDKLTLEEQQCKLFLKISQELTDILVWREEWQKMEEEGDDPERRAALIQRIREGSKKIRKMDKMDRGTLKKIFLKRI